MNQLSVYNYIPCGFEGAGAEKGAVDGRCRARALDHGTKRFGSADAVFGNSRGDSHIRAVQVGSNDVNPGSVDFGFLIGDVR